MKSMEEIANSQEPIVEDLDKQYDDIIARLQEAKANQEPIDEGIIGALVGGIAGATIGPKVMRAVCNTLGIDEKGALGSLMTSRLILTTLCGKMGWRL